jgi:hypothetical protein
LGEEAAVQTSAGHMEKKPVVRLAEVDRLKPTRTLSVDEIDGGRGLGWDAKFPRSDVGRPGRDDRERHVRSTTIPKSSNRSGNVRDGSVATDGNGQFRIGQRRECDGLGLTWPVR